MRKILFIIFILFGYITVNAQIVTDTVPNVYGSKRSVVLSSSAILDSVISTYLKTVTLSNTDVIHNAPTYSYNPTTKNYTITQTLANQSPYQALSRASGTGVPSWNSLDSNYFGGNFQTQVRAAQTTSGTVDTTSRFGGLKTIYKAYNDSVTLAAAIAANTFNITNNTNKIPQLPYNVIGVFYDSSKFNDLSGFVKSASGYSLNANNNIKIIGDGTGNATQYIGLPNSFMIDNYTTSFTYKYLSLNTTSPGVVAWERSINTASIKADISAYLNTAVGSNFGKVVIFTTVNNTTQQTIIGTTSIPSISIGDSLEIILSRNEGSYTATAFNYTKGTKASVYVARNFQYGGAGIGMTNNSAQFKIVANTTDSIVVCNIKMASHSQYQPPIALLGNSIIDGSFAAVNTARVTNILNIVNCGGSGDVSGATILNLPFVYTAIKPKSAFVFVNINDANNGVDYATNYTKIHDTLLAHNIDVVFLLATPSNGTDVTGMNNYVIARGWQYIDTYTPLWSGTGTGLNAAYNSGDGTHINGLGNAAMAAAIAASNYYKKYFIYQGKSGIRYATHPSFATTDTLAIPDISQVNTMIAAASTGGGSSDVLQTITASATIANGTTLLQVNPAALAATVAITMPATPTALQLITIIFGGTVTSGNPVVTSFTIAANTGQTLVQNSNPNGAIVAGDVISYRFISPYWYRIN